MKHSMSETNFDKTNQLLQLKGGNFDKNYFFYSVASDFNMKYDRNTSHILNSDLYSGSKPRLLTMVVPSY